MMVIDQVVGSLEAGDHGNHVGTEKLLQILRGFLLPGVALPVDLRHAERDLGRPKTQDRRGVKNRFGRVHGNTGKRTGPKLLKTVSDSLGGVNRVAPWCCGTHLSLPARTSFD